MKQKDYLVGGHSFRLEMEENHSLWTRLEAYAPFETEEISPSLFTLIVLDELPLVPDNAYFHKLGDFDSEGTSMIVYRSGANEHLFLLSPIGGNVCCSLFISSDYHTATACISGGEYMQSFGLNNSMMMLYTFTTATLNTLLVHASVILNGGKGYLFLGKSGTGKSTHTRLWLNHIEGSELLNDDNPVVRIVDGQPIVFGTPWSGKTPCYRNESAPVGGIVRLAQAPENRMTQLKGLKAYAAVFPSCSCMKWEKAMADGVHRTLEMLLHLTTIFHLECLPDAAAAVLSARTLQEEKK